jgi:hypothetical protein
MPGTEHAEEGGIAVARQAAGGEVSESVVEGFPLAGAADPREARAHHGRGCDHGGIEAGPGAELLPCLCHHGQPSGRVAVEVRGPGAAAGELGAVGREQGRFGLAAAAVDGEDVGRGAHALEDTKRMPLGKLVS